MDDKTVSKSHIIELKEETEPLFSYLWMLISS